MDCFSFWEHGVLEFPVNYYRNAERVLSKTNKKHITGDTQGQTPIHRHPQCLVLRGLQL